MKQVGILSRQIVNAERDGGWWVFYETEMPGWHDQRGVLSARLSDEDFETVTQSAAELQRLGHHMRQAVPRRGPGAPSTPACAYNDHQGDE
jgi:hypothetical protein